MIYRDATKDDWRDVYARDSARGKEKPRLAREEIQAGIESVACAIDCKHIAKSIQFKAQALPRTNTTFTQSQTY